MYETGKQAKVIKEMMKNQSHHLGISECRQTDFGENMTNSGEAIIYSGGRDGRHHEGVANVLRKVAARSLIEYNPVSESIKTSIIHVYSSTNEAVDKVKLDFYDALYAELKKIKNMT